MCRYDFNKRCFAQRNGHNCVDCANGECKTHHPIRPMGGYLKVENLHHQDKCQHCYVVVDSPLYFCDYGGKCQYKENSACANPGGKPG